MTTMIEIKVPDIGDFDAVPVIEVLVSVGDRIAAEESLITLESDKATMDIPAPQAGIISELFVSEGDNVSEGTVIATLQVEEQTTESVASKAPPLPAQPAAAPVLDAGRESCFEASGTKAPPILPSPAQRSGMALPHASPGIRRFARELGADLTQVRGTGSKNRITKDDVKLWVKNQLASSGTSGGGGIPPIPEVDFTQFGEIEIEKLGRIKSISGPHLQRAWLNIPHVTHHDEADITEVEAFRKSLKEEAEKRGIRITLLSFMMKALVVGLKEFPQFNASLSPDGKKLILKKYFNIGIAVDTPNGLMVPVISDVDTKSIYDLSHDLMDISSRAREGKLTGDDLKGGCMTISSLGGIGGTAFTPIVNAPEVAILGITRAKMQPVWDGEEFKPRLMLPLDLSYDHRAVDGAEAARFMAFLVRAFSDMRRLLL